MTTKIYMCGVDYRHEMDRGSARNFDSVDELKTYSECWEECGIVEVELDEAANEVGMQWIVEPEDGVR